MAASEVSTLLSRAWKEQWSVENWTVEVCECTDKLSDENLKKFLFQLTGENKFHIIIQILFEHNSQDCFLKDKIK